MGLLFWNTDSIQRCTPFQAAPHACRTLCRSFGWRVDGRENVEEQHGGYNVHPLQQPATVTSRTCQRDPQGTTTMAQSHTYLAKKPCSCTGCSPVVCCILRVCSRTKASVSGLDSTFCHQRFRTLSRLVTHTGPVLGRVKTTLVLKDIFCANGCEGGGNTDTTSSRTLFLSSLEQGLVLEETPKACTWPKDRRGRRLERGQREDRDMVHLENRRRGAGCP